MILNKRFKKGISLVEVTITISVIAAMLLLYKFVLADIIKEVGYKYSTAKIIKQSNELNACIRKHFEKTGNIPFFHANGTYASWCNEKGYTSDGDFSVKTLWPGVYVDVTPGSAHEAHPYWIGRTQERNDTTVVDISKLRDGEGVPSYYTAHEVTWTAGLVTGAFCQYFNNEVNGYNGTFYKWSLNQSDGRYHNGGHSLYCQRYNSSSPRYHIISHARMVR